MKTIKGPAIFLAQIAGDLGDGQADFAGGARDEQANRRMLGAS